MREQILKKKNIVIVLIILLVIASLGTIVWVKTFRFNFNDYDDVEIVSFDAWYPYGEKGTSDMQEQTKILPVSGRARREILEVLDSNSYARVKDVGYGKNQEQITIIRTKIKLKDQSGTYHYYDVYISDVNKMEIMDSDTKKRSFYLPKGIKVQRLYRTLMDIAEDDR